MWVLLFGVEIASKPLSEKENAQNQINEKEKNKMQINVTNIDDCKASPKKEHIFIPKAINVDLDDDEKVKIYCKYFKSMEKLDFAKYEADGSIRYDIKGIFKSKVSKIENLTLRDASNKVLKLETADEVLNLIAIPEIDSMIVETAMHLIAGDNLTRDEIKNSESAINS